MLVSSVGQITKSCDQFYPTPGSATIGAKTTRRKKFQFDKICENIGKQGEWGFFY